MLLSTKKYLAEFIGTFWLVLGGCGSAVLAAQFPNTGIGFVGVAFAFGLSLLTMAYAIGQLSGCHINPAVSVGFVVAKRMSASDLLPYIASQVIGACCASGVLYLIAAGKPEFSLSSGFAANGYGAHSPGAYSLAACFTSEFIFTFLFVFIILAVTEKNAPKNMGPLAIGLTLTVIHLVSIPVTNTSVNPARSTGPALFVGGWALQQLWLFWVGPLVAAALAGIAHSAMAPLEEPVPTPARKTAAA